VGTITVSVVTGVNADGFTAGAKSSSVAEPSEADAVRVAVVAFAAAEVAFAGDKPAPSAASDS